VLPSFLTRLNIKRPDTWLTVRSGAGVQNGVLAPNKSDASLTVLLPQGLGRYVEVGPAAYCAHGFGWGVFQTAI